MFEAVITLSPLRSWTKIRASAPGTGAGSKALITVGHALQLDTWRSFERTGLGPKEAAEVMADAVSAVAERP